jgi:uncharacterized membrane protein
MTPTIPGLMANIVGDIAEPIAQKLATLANYLELERHQLATSVGWDAKSIASLCLLINSTMSDNELKHKVKQTLSLLETKQAKHLTRPLSLMVETL